MKFPIQNIKIGLVFDSETIPVGRLSIYERKIYFEYDASFLNLGLNISPLNCLVEPGVKEFDVRLFNGLPGVFYDSLPDGWGHILFNRYMKKHNIDEPLITQLDRLANVGCWGMGALIYEPDYSINNTFNKSLDLDNIADYSEQILKGEASDVLDELIALNGSSAGARPKAMIGLNKNKDIIVHGERNLDIGFEHWLVKFLNTQDGNDKGIIEYIYSLMAKDAGIEMEETHLFPTKKKRRYFATKRFDRKKTKRLHMHSASGILHSNFRDSSLDYEQLMRLTMHVTKDIREVEKMYRVAVFNVLSSNCDDHGKNFSFLMDENGTWKLSPAYDITFSYSGRWGERSTTVLGEGKYPTQKHLISLGEKFKLPLHFIHETLEKTKDSLSKWLKLSKELEVFKDNVSQIFSKIEAAIKR
jgi:serine/threonine-protein kinase HipA